MTFPTSGQLDWIRINTELMQPTTTPLSIGDARLYSLAGKVSPNPINLTDFYGKTYIRYGTPSGSITRPDFNYRVTLSVTNGHPNHSLAVAVRNPTLGPDYTGWIEVGGSGTGIAYTYLNSSGNWTYTFNVQYYDDYWYPPPRANYFDFYQNINVPVTIYTPVPPGSGTFIGTVVLSS